MSEDEGCVKCGAYAGGANLCIVCEKLALKKKIRKPRKKKIDPIIEELIWAIEPGEDCEDEMRDCQHCRLLDLVARARARFKI